MASSQSTPDPIAARWPLVLIILVYALLAGLYAVNTPAWQAPDEPAHYNYIRDLAETRRLPELRPGDYPVAYLEEIKAQRFPPEMSIDPIRYEAHQPPLYYLLAAPVFILARAAGMETPLLPLRLVSVALGILSLIAAHGVMRRALTQHPQRARWLALGTAAFMATLPMHVAMTAVINNDVLVELVLALVVWQLLIIHQEGWTTRRSLLMGLLLGLALLTKLQAYIAAGLVALGWMWDAVQARRNGRALGPLVGQAALVGGVALMLVLPWLARNMAVYGIGDPLAMARHDAVVVGQLTTPELAAEVGRIDVVRRLVQTTFQSFWGQFGWMGVLLPVRVYQGLAALCMLALLGLLDALGAIGKAWRVPQTRYSLTLVGAWGALTVAGFLWYNLHYVQHQGRYLYPAIAVWGLLFTAGIWRLLARRPAWALGVLGMLALVLVIAGLVMGDLMGFTTALAAAAAVGLVLGHAAERRLPGLPLTILYTGMAGLALWALRHMVPFLRP